MRRLCCAGLVLAFTSHGAWAQTPPPPPAPATADSRKDDHPPPPPPEDRDDDWGRGGMHGHRPPPSKAARFRIDAGDISIGVKCPEDEALRACADFTLQVIDKLGNLPRR